MTIASQKPPLAGRPDRAPARRLRRSLPPLEPLPRPLPSSLRRPVPSGGALNLRRPLILIPGLATLTGCSAQSGATEAVGGAIAVLLIGATAVVVRRVTARPLERARARADRNLSQLLEERTGLLAERDRLLAERDAQQGARQRLTQEYEELQRLHQELTAAHGAAVGRLAELGREGELLLAERDGLVLERDELAKERDELQGSVDATFVNLAMRTLTLVERQLVLIEALEDREADAAQLESLFRLDHLATRMRRNSENMLLLAGLENSRRSRKTVTLLDVVRAAVSEIERYERVRLGFLAAVRLTGAVADDTSHLLAELLENATAFSPPHEQVEVGGWLLDNGELMLSVTDRGIGLPAERLRVINEQLAEPAPQERAERRDALLAGALTGRSMGLFVVARLAARHGLRVQLRENGQGGGGVTAMVVLPREALQQDGASSADLDEQRRAERSAAAEAARAAEGAGSAELPRVGGAQGAFGVAAAAAAVPASGQGPAELPDLPDLPELPRRRPAHAEPEEADALVTGAEPSEPPASSEPSAVSGAAESSEPSEPSEPSGSPEPSEPPALPQRRAVRPEPGHEVVRPAPEDPPTQQLMLRQLRDGLARSAAADRLAEQAAASGPAVPAEPGAPAEPVVPAGPVPPAAPVVVTDPGAPELPRRAPRGTGLPGTGEAPASGLHRAGRPGGAPYGGPADESDRTAGQQAPRGASARIDAEELRRRLGGFQSGLRRAARETAAAERAEEQDR